MPIIRKVIKIGDSKAVTLPKTWLDFFEKEIGEEIGFVTIEVDKKLTIAPYTPKKENSDPSVEKG